MPMPTILPIPDHKAIFSSGQVWTDWLKNKEYQANCDRMVKDFDSLVLAGTDLETIACLARKVHIITIAEPWCGDVVRHMPYVVKLVEAAGKMADLRFIDRASRPDYFARFLTNGGEAIPKFIFLSEDFIEVGNWGPMSSTPRRLIACGKACNDVGAARRKVSEFYTMNQGAERRSEILDLFEIAATKNI